MAGVLDPEVLNEAYVGETNRLVDAAKDGQRSEVLDLLDSSYWLTSNQWRIGGRSCFTPLRQAAWRGDPVEVAVELVGRGAWRSLNTASGERPIDIARRRGHDHLLDFLVTPDLDEHERRKYATWNRHLADLIAEEIRGLRLVQYRKVPTEVIVLEGLDYLWFGYPGVHGGFYVVPCEDGPVAWSSSRMGGDGPTHVINKGGRARLEGNFV